MAENASDDGTTLKELSITELQNTRNDMLKRDNWKAASAAGVSVFRSYVQTLNEIQTAIRSLQNAQLQQSVQQMKALESDLRAGIDDLKEARERIDRVEGFVAAAAKVLELVAKVVKAVT